MPLITLAEIKALGFPNIETQCDINSTNFTGLEQEAAQIVADETGITIPDSVNNAPSWSKLPATWIIYYITITRKNSSTAEDKNMARQFYNDALARLAKHKTKPSASPAGLYSAGDITEKYIW